MVHLSVNINKIATLRNARGGNIPDLLKAAINIQRYGADGITVHPRPDERHIRYRDVFEIKPLIVSEFNIEGNPTPSFLELVLKVKPQQVTLVPDPPDAITSSAGWDTFRHKSFLQEVTGRLREAGIRSSIFIDPVPEMIFHAVECGTDRIELYTEAYAAEYASSPEGAISPYLRAAEAARESGLGINAGHDLNLQNLRYFCEHIRGLEEVSIGQALIADALYYGLENTVQMYKRQLRATQ
jgi:pyridoxine 5-phosphate synthase